MPALSTKQPPAQFLAHSRFSTSTFEGCKLLENKHARYKQKNSVFTFLCKEKPGSSPLFLSFESPLLFTKNTLLLILLVTKCVRVFSPSTTIKSPVPTGCPTIQLSYISYNTIYWVIASDLTGKSSVPPTRSPSPHLHFGHQVQAQVITSASDQLASDWKFPQPLP